MAGGKDTRITGRKKEQMKGHIVRQNSCERSVEMLICNSQRSRRYGFTQPLWKGAGFTVLELLIVVVIIGIAAVIAVPMIGSASSIQIRSAARQIVADMEYAKSMAVGRQKSYSVVFDAASESYDIRNSSGTVIGHPVRKGFDYVIDFGADSRVDDVDIVSVSFDGTSEIKFDYLGGVYNGNNNPLNSGVINLEAGGMSMTINVEPVTGFILISE